MQKGKYVDQEKSVEVPRSVGGVASMLEEHRVLKEGLYSYSHSLRYLVGVGRLQLLSVCLLCRHLPVDCRQVTFKSHSIPTLIA